MIDPMMAADPGGAPAPDAGPGGMFPSIDPMGPVGQLMQMVQGVQQQDHARLSMAQNAILAMLMQGLMQTNMGPEQGFAEGAAGDIEADPTGEAAAGGPPAPEGM